jgi:hypothetical protein
VRREGSPFLTKQGVVVTKRDLGDRQALPH